MVSGAVKVKGCASRFAGEKGEFLDAMAGEFINSTNRGSFYSLAATRYVQKFGYVIYGESPQLSNLSAESKVTELERRKKFLPWLRTVRSFYFLYFKKKSMAYLALCRLSEVGSGISTGVAVLTKPL